MKKVSFVSDRKAAENKKKKTTIALSMLIAVILVSSSLLILVQNDFNLKTAIGGQEETNSVTQEMETEIQAGKTIKYFFLWCGNADKTGLDFMWIIKTQMPERKINICALSPYRTVEYNGETSTLSSVYAEFGEKILKETAEKSFGLKFDGYIGATPEKFKQMINYFGSINISVEEKVEYKGGFNLILMDGTIGMKGDTLYKYLCYLGTLGDKGLKERAQTLSEVFSAVLDEKYLEKEDRIFAKIANILYTDMSILEFSQSRDNINEILTNGVEKYEMSESTSILKK